MTHRESVRVIPEVFLGAILGAWLGNSLNILDQPFYISIWFIAAIIGIAIVMSVVILDYPTRIRFFAVMTFMAWIGTSGLVFYATSIFNVDNLIFYVVFFGGWLATGFFTKVVDSSISGFVNEKFILDESE